MPYKSLAQEHYFHAHKKELEKQGVNVGEWDRATKGRHLPMHANVQTCRTGIMPAPNSHRHAIQPLAGAYSY